MYKKAWQKLAKAIIKRALKDIKENNKHKKDAELFLSSDWCKNLEYLVNLDICSSDVITYKINI